MDKVDLGKTHMEEDVEVILKYKDWKKLTEDQRLLRALYQAGVDFWDGYMFALDLLDTESE